MKRLFRLLTYYITVILMFSGHHTFAQIFQISSNLPLIRIDTQGQQIKDEPKITAKMKVYYNADGTLNNLQDTVLHYDAYIGIEIRGSSAQTFPKKSYSIETRDSSGNNLDFPLIGLPAENDWVLYAPYSDKSLIRNFLAYRLYASMGHYAPRTRFCEVVINNTYEGVYVLTEKIKRDDKRVDISRLREQDIADDQLTGGYILQVDRPDGLGWYSEIPPFAGASQKVFYQLVYPKADEVQNAQLSYIKSFVSDFESSLMPESFKAADHEFIHKFDINSFVDYLIINELSKNVDAFRLSTFMYKDRDDRDGRLVIGPVWDYNLSFGNADYYRGQYTDGWQLNLSHQDQYQPPFWIEKLWQDEMIYNKVCARWDELRNDLLKDMNLSSYIRNISAEIRDAADRNFSRWNILGVKVWPNPYIHNSYDNEIDYLIEWIQERSEWIDDNIETDFSRVNWNKEQIVYTEKRQFVLPNNHFYSDLKKIDRVKFISSTDRIDVANSTDSVSITLYSDDYQSFIGVGYYQGEIVDVSQLYTVTTSVASSSEQISPPVKFELKQNYPNPFNPNTTIEYSIPAENFSDGSIVKLRVYDITGREVSTIVDKKQRPGLYKVQFEAGEISSGVYFYTLSFGNYRATEKMLLIK